MTNFKDEIIRYQNIAVEYCKVIKDAIEEWIPWECFRDIRMGWLYGKKYLRNIVDDTKIQLESSKDNWKLGVVETISKSLDQFEFSSIPTGSREYFFTVLESDSDILKTREDLELINNNNEAVLKKLKKDLKTVLVANRL